MAVVSRRSLRLPFSTLTTILCLLWLCASSTLAASAVLGIDFGTEYIKAALVKPGIPLEIVLTKDSRRKETSAVAFKPLKNILPGEFPEREYGSDAMALAARFPGEVYPNIKALLGLPANDSIVKEYAFRHPSIRLEADETRRTATFRSNAFGQDETAWMVEEILAMELKSIQKNAEALAGRGSTIRDIVITVPPYFAAEERRAIQLSAEFAGLRVLSLISDGLAVGINYATTRNFPSVTEGGEPEYHLVFDMGAGSTKATVIKFQGRTVKDVGKFNKTIQEVRVLGTGWDRTLGGDMLNAVIVDDMISSFVASKPAKSASIEAERVHSHGRTIAKLSKEAERLRHVLSANAEAQASFEGLFEDIDFRYKLSRVDFEKMAESYADRVLPTINTALEKANMKVSDIDSIILHGGAVRTPFIQKQLEKIVGTSDKLRSNVNADEAAVFGAAFKGASLSPSFRVKEIRSFDVAGHSIKMKWTNNHDKPQQEQLFVPQTQLGLEKVVSFRNLYDFEVRFHQLNDAADEVAQGSNDREVMTLVTKNLTTSVSEILEKHGCIDSNILVKLGIRLTAENGAIEITKAALHCEVEESDKKGSVVDGVKGLFGFGAKRSDQDVFQDADTVHDSTISIETSSESSRTASASSSPSPQISVSSSHQDDKSKTAKRLITVPLDYTIEMKGYPILPTEEFILKKERLEAFDDSDRSRLLREEAFNQLEAFTYRARDMVVDESFILASIDAERTAFEEMARSASEWLYGEGADASKEDLQRRLKQLKNLVHPIERRREEHSRRPEHVKLLREALEQTQSFIDMAKDKLKQEKQPAASIILDETETTAAMETSTTDDEFAGLEDDESATSTTTTSTITSSRISPTPMYSLEDVELAKTVHSSVREWFEATLTKQEKLDAAADPVLLVKDLAMKAQELNKAGMDLLMKVLKEPESPKLSSSRKTSKSKKTKVSKTKVKTSSETSYASESTSTTSGDTAAQPENLKSPDREHDSAEAAPIIEEILEDVDTSKSDQEGNAQKHHKIDEL